MNREPNSRARTTRLGTGELHQALEDAHHRETLTRFCSAHVCTPAEVSEDGKRLHLPQVLQLMRKRGYQVSDPKPAAHQPKKGFTAWLVHVQLPRVEFDLGFYTRNTDKAGSTKKPQPSNLEHA